MTQQAFGKSMFPAPLYVGAGGVGGFSMLRHPQSATEDCEDKE